MSKIIGNTIVTPMAVPDWDQENPRMADYIENKPDYDGLKEQVDAVSGLIGDTTVSDQITSAVAQKAQVQIITWGADD